MGWCIVCEGVSCFQRRGVCLVGSMGIVSFVVLLFFLVCVFHVVVFCLGCEDVIYLGLSVSFCLCLGELIYCLLYFVFEGWGYEADV